MDHVNYNLHRRGCGFVSGRCSWLQKVITGSRSPPQGLTRPRAKSASPPTLSDGPQYLNSASMPGNLVTRWSCVTSHVTASNLTKGVPKWLCTKQNAFGMPLCSSSLQVILFRAQTKLCGLLPTHFFWCLGFQKCWWILTCYQKRQIDLQALFFHQFFSLWLSPATTFVQCKVVCCGVDRRIRWSCGGKLLLAHIRVE